MQQAILELLMNSLLTSHACQWEQLTMITSVKVGTDHRQMQKHSVSDNKAFVMAREFDVSVQNESWWCTPFSYQKVLVTDHIFGHILKITCHWLVLLVIMDNKQTMGENLILRFCDWIMRRLGVIFCLCFGVK